MLNNHYFEDFGVKTLHSVLILKGRGGATQDLYTRLDIPSLVFMKWTWYFRYRAALFQIQYPKSEIILDYGSMRVEEEKAIVIKKIERQIILSSGKIRKMKENRLLAIQNWTELFPLQQEDEYITFCLKIDHEIERLFLLKAKLTFAKNKEFVME